MTIENKNVVKYNNNYPISNEEVTYSETSLEADCKALAT